MAIHLQNLPLPVQVIVCYLLIGLCTQLPGVVYGHFLHLSQFRQYASSGFATKFGVGVRWLVFTTVLWFVPFLRAGVTWISLALVALGLATSITVLWIAHTLQGALGAAVIGGLLSLVVARRYRLRG